MIKFINIYCFFICVSNFIYAQGNIPINEKAYSDSLEAVLKKTSSDSVKARTYFLLSDYWRLKDTIKGKQYLLKGQLFGNKNAFNHALYHFFEGQLYFNFNANKAAEAFLKASKELSPFNTREAYQFRANSYFDYGIMEQGTKGYPFFIDITLNKAIPLMEKTGNKEKIAHFYSQLGMAFMYNSQFDKAAIYLKKAIDLLELKYPTSSTLLLADPI